jgi:hypothetical protein
MKNLILFFSMAFVAFSCQLQNDEVLISDRSSAADLADYTVDASSNNGFTFTFDISINNGAKDISHLTFNFNDCEGAALKLINVLSFSVDGVSIPLNQLANGDPTCTYAEGSFPFKLDNGYSEDIQVVIVLDTKSSGGTATIKAGNAQSGGGCFAYDFVYDCGSTPEPCYDYKGETAWAAGSRYIARGNWATFTPYAEGSVNLYAGQHMFAGTVNFSAVNDGMVTITIELDEEWSFQEGDKAVKVQAYDAAPSGNPSPGRFTSYKGNEVEFSVPAANFYGIHLDVQKMVEVECPVDSE